MLIVRFICALVLAALAAPALAQSDYPNKPVKIVVPFPAGGPNDFFARVLGNKINQMTSQPVVIENHPGAAGVVGCQVVVNSPPDGYTLVLTSMGALTIVPSISEKAVFDPYKDLAQVTLVAKVPEVLVAIPQLGVHDVKELVAKAKAQPGKINFASAGSGGMPHLAGELFKREAAIDIIHIPYRGAAPAVNDLLGGHVDIMFADIPILLPHIESGKLTALFLGTTGQRSPTMPKVPTSAEVGYPKATADNWYALLAPGATPKPLIQKINQVVVAALKAPDLQEMYLKQGGLASPTSPEEFIAYQKSETEKWGGLAKSAGVKIE
jgi:tripartite-type tricarboxylate transporter receptor subunit TctC